VLPRRCSTDVTSCTTGRFPSRVSTVTARRVVPNRSIRCHSKLNLARKVIIPIRPRIPRDLPAIPRVTLPPYPLPEKLDAGKPYEAPLFVETQPSHSQGSLADS